MTSLEDTFGNVTSLDDTFGNVTSLDDTFGNVTSVVDTFNNVTSLEGEFQFNRRLLLNVIAYTVMFVVGTIGNTVVSFSKEKRK